LAKLKETIRNLKITAAVLTVVVVALALYIVYPSISLAINGSPFGSRLTGIDSPISQMQLSTINNASNSNFEIAGEMMLNGSISGETISNNSVTGPLFEVSFAHPAQYNALIINGKPSVIYIGAISCIYCGENRWAMALALSRFGSFKSLYTGYSSFGDGDLPTLYWVPQNYTTKGKITIGNNYTSNTINFYSAEFDSPITGGFELPATQNPIQYFVANVTTNPDYSKAIQFMNSTNAFEGTPFTFWGRSMNVGADGVVFGNGTSQSSISNKLPLTYLSHQQLFDLLHNFNSTFAYEEYAVSDVYVAEVCSSINNNATVCSLSAIRQIESRMGLG
jgi:hypothetical protein